MSWTRRDFLRRGLGSAACLPWLSSLGRAPSGAGRDRGEEHVLVVVQLTGGNDGLNTLVPHRQDEYYRSRPNLALRPRALHALDDEHALHPALAAWARQFDAGRLAIVHGVGGPRPERSHFRSLDIWHSARVEGEAARTGWLGRLAEQIAGSDPLAMPALSLDDGPLPLCLQAERLQVPTLSDPRAYRLHGAARRVALRQRACCAAPIPDDDPDLAFLRRAAVTAFEAADRMQSLRSRERPVSYPSDSFARKLRLISDLVQGGFGSRIFHLSLDGFDTHARQAPLHEALLRRLANALDAFQEDLEGGGCGARVTTLVFSEFGRRVRENGSAGTDHGYGAPLFLMGSAVRGGLHGRPPRLDRLVDGDLPATTDFRSIYSALETEWLGLQAGTEVSALPGLFRDRG